MGLNQQLRRLPVWGLLFGGLSGACSLLYDPPDQCEKDSDCLRLAEAQPELRETYCEQGVCTLPNTDPSACTTNHECIVKTKSDSICRNNHCVPLRSSSCGFVVNRDVLEKEEDVIVLGAFAVLNDSEPSPRTGLESYGLAFKEMTEQVRGAATNATSTRRPLVMVVCDAKKDFDQSIDHLTTDLRVPVIVSTLRPTVLAAQWNRIVDAPNVDTMFINAVSTNSALSFAAKSGRIFSLLGDAVEELGAAYEALVKYQVAQATAESVHLVMVVNDDQGMKDVADTLERTTTLSRIAAGQNAYRRVSATDAAAVQQALVAVAPQVVIVLAGDEAVPFIADSESVAQAAGTKRYYVLSHGLYNSGSLKVDIPDLPDVSQRMLGINFAGAPDQSLYLTYFNNLRDEFEQAIAGYENYYDAAHFAMLSVMATAADVPTAQLTGSLAAQGFRRLRNVTSPSKMFRLEPRALPSIVSALENTPDYFEVLGTMGEPAFSESTAARHTGASVWCLRPSAVSDGAFDFYTDPASFIAEANNGNPPSHCFDVGSSP